MRLSTSTNIMNFDQGVNYAIPMEDSIPACARAGYRYIDANLCGACRPGQALTKPDWEDWTKKCRELADSLGLTFTQAHAYFPLGKNLGPDGREVDGAHGEEMMRRSVLAAEILGAKWMVVHPFTIWEESGYSLHKSYQYNREYYYRWAEEFGAHHLNLAIENMSLTGGKPRYGVTPEELLDLTEGIGLPNVGICVDTGHAHLSGLNVADFLRGVGDHLHATHIADNHRNADEHFAPFNGTIDWKPVMKALRDIGYQDDFAFEIHHLTSAYPREVQQELVNFSYRLGNYLMEL